MIKVGITGGIGSGKSLVCQVFSRLGIPVYNADMAARKIMERDRAVRKKLTDMLGRDVYEGNSLNRIKMAGLIFNNGELLTRVNLIVHPAVTVDFQKWCDTVGNFRYVIHESAILFESEIYRLFDFIVLVTAPVEVRLKRVITRSGMTHEKIQSIMKNQPDEKENMLRSHLVLNNDGNNMILPRILDLHAEWMQSR
jgi:dephospho-CoA kinase